MANIYISYRSTERQFVESVVSRLKRLGHTVRVDYAIPVGADWRSHQLTELRDSEVFLLFVSKETRSSDFQNSEMGAARIWSTFVDQKQLIPVLLDDVEPPRPLAHLDGLRLPTRDAEAAATAIDEVIRVSKPRVRLFVSHAHRDASIAARLVDAIATTFKVPDGELRCTSVPGYQLDLGSSAGTTLQRELGSTACVVALLTPNSLNNDWVLFELGAAWSHARLTLPLLAHGLQDRDLPGPLRGAAGGQLSELTTLDRLMEQVETATGWPRRPGIEGRSKSYQVVQFVEEASKQGSTDAAVAQPSFWKAQGTRLLIAAVAIATIAVALKLGSSGVPESPSQQAHAATPATAAPAAPSTPCPTPAVETTLVKSALHQFDACLGLNVNDCRGPASDIRKQCQRLIEQIATP